MPVFKNGQVPEKSVIPAPMVNGKMTLRILVDRASLEIFVNNGQTAGSFLVVPKFDNRSIHIKHQTNQQLENLLVNELKSIGSK